MSVQSLGEALFPGQVGGKTIRFVEQEPFIWLFSGCGCIIYCDAIFLRTARRPMWQDGGWVGVNDGLRETASFASLTNWGKSWSYVGRRAKRKKQGWRRGGGEERKRETVQSPVARGHNLQHLLAVIDQGKRREGNGVCGLTWDEVMG